MKMSFVDMNGLITRVSEDEFIKRAVLLGLLQRFQLDTCSNKYF